MTLALLLTAVTGAWAQSTVTWTEADLTGSGSDLTTYTKDGVTIKCSDRLSSGKSFNGPVTISTTLGNFTKIEITGQGSAPIQSDIFTNDGNTATWTGNASSLNFPNVIAYATQFVFTIEPAEAPLTVEWNAASKTGTFAMPGSDVVLTPIYAKAATFATTGTESEVKTLLPEAAEGVIAGTDAPLIAEGTGIVAFAGTSTEAAQGTLMYAVGNSATEAPALTAFSATVPTAKNVADDGATVYVWYYIQGADAPTNVAATLDNTFDDTEPACLTVTVLTNKFDITFNAANANTIEAGKATVTVGGTDKTEDITDGKLQGVKMGSEVKLEAKPGYKFRKVEVKKAASTPSLNITNPAVGQVIGSDGKNYAAASVPSGVDKVAMIAYVNGSNGLAIALADEGEMNWSTAIETCAAHTPAFTGGTWKLASKDEWDNMITAAGSYTDLRDGFSSVGGTNMLSNYWSSTESNAEGAWYYYFDYGGWADAYKDTEGNAARACLAF